MQFLFVTLTSICVCIRTSAISYFSWHATSNLHSDMIKKVLNAPINLYFDVTPIGRILNKFSNDLQCAEDDLCWCLASTISCFYISLCTIIISVSASPWLLVILPIIFYLLQTLSLCNIRSERDSKSIDHHKEPHAQLAV
jgi:ABC-type multidrug transport system fused ATPase/permease subunit